MSLENIRIENKLVNSVRRGETSYNRYPTTELIIGTVNTVAIGSEVYGQFHVNAAIIPLADSILKQVETLADQGSFLTLDVVILDNGVFRLYGVLENEEEEDHIFLDFTSVEDLVTGITNFPL